MPPPNRRPLHILVVDDSKTVQRLVEVVLQRLGYKVSIAADGPQGLTIAEREQPDLILFDFVMPGMYGHVFCKKVRQIKGLENTPLVLISSKSDSIAYYFDQAGVVHRLKKPFAPSDLVKAIRELLGEHATVPVARPAIPAAAPATPPAASPTASPKVAVAAEVPPPQSPATAPADAAVAGDRLSPVESAAPAGVAAVAEPLETSEPVAGAPDAASSEPIAARPSSAPAPDAATLSDAVMSLIGERVDRTLQQFLRGSMVPMLRQIVLDTLSEAGLVERNNLLLSSSLDVLSLPDALNFAHHALLTGRLTLVSANLLGEVFLEKGEFTFARVSKRGGHEFLTDILLDKAQGAERRAKILHSIASARQHDQLIGRSLVQSGVITEDELHQALEQHARRALNSLLETSSGTFFLQSGPLPAELADVKLRLPMMQVLMDGLRQVDEKARAMKAFADDSAVLCQVIKNDDEMRLTEIELQVFSLADGQRTLRELLRTSDLAESETLKICLRLCHVGLLTRKAQLAAVE